MNRTVIQRFALAAAVIGTMTLGAGPARERTQTVSLFARPDLETPPPAPRSYPILLPLMESGRLSPERVQTLLDRDPAHVLAEIQDLNFDSDCVELTSTGAPNPPDSIDVQHYDIEVHEVDDPTEYFRATTTVHLTPIRTLDHFDLKMIKLVPLTMEISVDGAPFTAIPFTPQPAPGFVRILPSSPVSAGAQVRVRIEYEGTEPGCVNASGIFSGLVFTIGGGGFPTNGIHTFSEPAYGPYWFPCNDNPADQATFRITVTVPTGLVGSASGMLTDSTQVNGLDQLTWEITRPVATYLAAFYLGDYVKLTDTAPNGVALEYFTYPDRTAETLIDYSTVPDMMELYSSIHPYPNPRYAMTLSEFGGGMEHEMNALIGHFFIRGNRSLEHLFAHELAHMWWGNLLTMETWQEIWLNEGFATYMEALYHEHIYGFPAMRERSAFIDSVYIARINEPDSVIVDHPIFDPPLDGVFSFIVYQKGGRVLDMLRGVSRLDLMIGLQPPADFADEALAGDQRFLDILSQYTGDNAGENVTTADLQAAIEAHMGQDMSWFLDPWLNGLGYADLEVDWRSNSSGSGTRVDVMVRQSDAQAQLFTMPLHVRYQSSTETLDEVRMLDGKLVEWSVDLPPGDWQVILDPDDWLLDIQTERTLFPDFKTALAFPNPSSSGFTLSGTLEGTATEPGEVLIFDVAGRHIRTLDLGSVAPGPVQTVWDGLQEDGRQAPTGVYFAWMQIGPYRHTQRLVVVP